MFIATWSLVALLQVAGAPAEKAVAPVLAEDEKICRRIPVTGSLVRKERMCHTRAEWERMAEAGNRDARFITSGPTGVSTPY